MPTFNQLPVDDAEMERIDQFYGLHRAERLQEGEWRDDENLTSDQFPMLAVRDRRGILDWNNLGTVAEFIDMTRRSDKIVIAYRADMEEDAFYLQYEGNTGDPLRIPYNSAIMDYPTQFVGFGSYIILLGINIWVKAAQWLNGEDPEWGYINASVDLKNEEPNGVILRMEPCLEDGAAITIADWTAVEPGETITINTYLTIPGSGKVRKVSNAYIVRPTNISDEEWEADFESHDFTEEVETFRLMTSDALAALVPENSEEDEEETETGAGGIVFDNGDRVRVVPELTESSWGEDFTEFVVKSVTDDGGIVVDQYIEEAVEYTSGSAGTDFIYFAKRDMPDMDFVVECQNRLWGCKFGWVDGQLVNEIYASELGTYNSWYNFNNLANASYAAGVGTDGAFTGAITLNNVPLFFKENAVHKVMVSPTGAHQIVAYSLPGVQIGSGRSLCVVDGAVYYKGVHGVYMYDGSMPVYISEALGIEPYFKASAGGANGKLYVAMVDKNDHDCLFCYDIQRRIWHQESTAGIAACRILASGVSIYQLTQSGVVDLLGQVGTKEAPVEWSCTSGLIGYAVIEQKYISRFNLRVVLPMGSEMDVWVEYDSDGTWHHQGHAVGRGTGSFTLPVRPRRCDHFRIRMSGTGDMKMYSFAKMLQRGSDYV